MSGQGRECFKCGSHKETFYIGFDKPRWVCEDCVHAHRMATDKAYARWNTLAAAERAALEAGLKWQASNDSGKLDYVLAFESTLAAFRELARLRGES